MADRYRKSQYSTIKVAAVSESAAYSGEI